MYTLSVGAMFKNESPILKEWLDHYLFHGVEHFYLVNDDSTDSFMEVLQPYLDKNQITLFNSHKFPYYCGRQKDSYNHFILPHIKETKWLLMIDLDEYLWSPSHINLSKLLVEKFSHLAQIQINDLLFGSNGHIAQPSSIVNSFTRRETNARCFKKYIVNSDYDFISLNIHHATTVDPIYMDGRYFQLFDHNYFILNHYSCQSKQYWDEIKCTRGDGDHYRTRTSDDFKLLDINEIEDLRLVEQNKPLF